MLCTQKPCIVCYLRWMSCLTWYHQQNVKMLQKKPCLNRKGSVWIEMRAERVLWCIMSGGWARAPVTNHSVSTWLVLKTAWCRKPWKRSLEKGPGCSNLEKGWLYLKEFCNYLEQVCKDLEPGCSHLEKGLAWKEEVEEDFEWCFCWFMGHPQGISEPLQDFCNFPSQNLDKKKGGAKAKVLEDEGHPKLQEAMGFKKPAASLKKVGTRKPAASSSLKKDLEKG